MFLIFYPIVHHFFCARMRQKNLSHQFQTKLHPVTKTPLTRPVKLAFCWSDYPYGAQTCKGVSEISRLMTFHRRNILIDVCAYINCCFFFFFKGGGRRVDWGLCSFASDFSWWKKVTDSVKRLYRIHMQFFEVGNFET